MIAFLFGNLTRARTSAGLAPHVAAHCEGLKRDLLSARERPLFGRGSDVSHVPTNVQVATMPSMRFVVGRQSMDGGGQAERT